MRIYAPDLRALLLFDAAPRNPLLGVWNVGSYQDAVNSQAAPIEDSTLTATFGLLRLSGSGGCNTYDGTYSTNGSLHAVGRLATTLIACPDDVMAQEAAFLAALEGIGRIELRAQTRRSRRSARRPSRRPPSARPSCLSRSRQQSSTRSRGPS